MGIKDKVTRVIQRIVPGGKTGKENTATPEKKTSNIGFDEGGRLVSKSPTTKEETIKQIFTPKPNGGGGGGSGGGNGGSSSNVNTNAVANSMMSSKSPSLIIDTSNIKLNLTPQEIAINKFIEQQNKNKLEAQKVANVNAFLESERAKDILNRREQSQKAWELINQQSIIPESNPLEDKYYQNVESRAKSTITPTIEEVQSLGDNRGTIATIVGLGKEPALTGEEVKYVTSKVIDTKISEAKQNEFYSAYNTQVRKETDSLNPEKYQERINAGEDYDKVKAEYEADVREANNRLNQWSKEWNTNWDETRGQALARAGSKVMIDTSTVFNAKEVQSKVLGYGVKGAKYGSVITAGLLGVAAIPVVGPAVVTTIGVGGLLVGGAYTVGSVYGSAYSGIKSYSESRGLGFTGSQSVQRGLVTGATDLAPFAYGSAGALVGGYGVSRLSSYLTKPIVKVKTIKSPAMNLKSTETIGINQKITTKTGTVEKVIFNNQKVGQVGTSGSRTTVTTNWRNLANRYLGTKFAKVYEGVPSDKSGYTKAYNILRKAGYTDYQARNTLRYTAPKYIEQYLEKGLISADNTKATGSFTFTTQQKVVDINKRLGIKTKGGQTVKDIYEFTRVPLEDKPNVFVESGTRTSAIFRRGKFVGVDSGDYSLTASSSKASELIESPLGNYKDIVSFSITKNVFPGTQGVTPSLSSSKIFYRDLDLTNFGTDTGSRGNVVTTTDKTFLMSSPKTDITSFSSASVKTVKPTGGVVSTVSPAVVTTNLPGSTVKLFNEVGTSSSGNLLTGAVILDKPSTDNKKGSKTGKIDIFDRRIKPEIFSVQNPEVTDYLDFGNKSIRGPSQRPSQTQIVSQNISNKTSLNSSKISLNPIRPISPRVPTTRTPPRRPIKFPDEIITPPKIPDFRKKKTKESEQAYDVFAKRSGKWIKLADNVPYKAGLGIGSQYVDKESLSSQFKLTKDKGEVNQVKNGAVWGKIGNKFRNYMVRKGTKIQRTNVYIEKAKYRLDSPQEKKQISLSRNKLSRRR